MSKTHLSKVPDGLECAAYLIDIAEEDYCEYQTSDGLWHPSPYCSDVVKQLLDTGWDEYEKAIKEADCAAHFKRLLTTGPPLYLQDKTFSVSEGLFIQSVWYMSNNTTVPAKYRGAPEGEEREKMIQKLQEMLDIYAVAAEQENDSRMSDG